MKIGKGLLCCIVGTSLLLPNTVGAEKVKRVATVIGVEGKVWVKKAGGQREYPVYENMALTQGDLIRTEKDAKAKIVYGEATEASLPGNSKLMIAQLTTTGESNQTSMKLFAGKVWNKVKSLLNADDKYEVHTPTAVMGVQGTLFLISMDEDKSKVSVTVMDGTVGVEQNTTLSNGNENRPKELVSVNQELKVDTLAKPLPAKQQLDVKQLIETVDVKLLVKIIEDVIKTAETKKEEAKQAEAGYQQTKQLEEIKKAAQLATQAVNLAQTAKEILETTQSSSKAAEFQKELEKTQDTLTGKISQAEKLIADYQQTQKQIEDTAKTDGVDLGTTPPPPPPPSSNTGGSESNPVPKVKAEVVDQKLVIKASDFKSTPIYGIQVHLSLDAGYLIAEPTASDTQLFPTDWKQESYIKLNDRTGIPDDEVIYVQTLYNQTTGYSFSGERTVAIIDLPHLSTVQFPVKLLDVIAVDANGNKITNVEWSSTSINMK